MLPKILILGAGYGGITTVKRLQRELRIGEAEITLVNKHSYHSIATHLHQPAAGTAAAPGFGDRTSAARWWKLE